MRWRLQYEAEATERSGARSLAREEGPKTQPWNITNSLLGLAAKGSVLNAGWHHQTLEGIRTDNTSSGGHWLQRKQMRRLGQCGSRLSPHCLHALSETVPEELMRRCYQRFQGGSRPSAALTAAQA